jgi:trimethylamine:corrinoid methyltransferase-like protein
MNGLALITVEVTISDLRNTTLAFGGPEHEEADATACALAQVARATIIRTHS